MCQWVFERFILLRSVGAENASGKSGLRYGKAKVWKVISLVQNNLAIDVEAGKYF
jgi:hypothetical protein